ncbi:MAG: flagellar biosynthesis anti-sigma factor FlgM [Phycisphaerales bacterium]|jgi:anti-sigma28 factor (negative regulator of flagellin synthesis)
MSDIAPLSSGSSLLISQATRAYSRTAESAAPTDTPRRGTDQVEVSSVASYLSQLRDLPVRQDLVDRVRAEIASGTYETPEKVDGAITEIGRDLA